MILDRLEDAGLTWRVYSVIATLSRLHGPETLTRRDAASNDLMSVLNP